MIGDPFGGLEIPLHAGILHELHVAKIREPLAAYLIADEVPFDVEIESGQILNRISVLAASETAYRNAARIALVLLRVIAELGANPGDRFPTIRIARLRLLFRRPSFLPPGRRSLLPVLEAVADRPVRAHLLDTDPPRRVGLAVTLYAVVAESGGGRGGYGIGSPH